MAAGSIDRPPMLATRRYAQWQSCFSRYVDTKSNKQELRKGIFDGPYVMTKITIPAKPTTTTTKEAVPDHNVPKTYKHTTPEKLDACTTAKEIWIAIERLRQGELLNKQDVKTNLFWEFGKFTLKDRESIESYYSRFYKRINEKWLETSWKLLLYKQELEAHYMYMAKIQEVLTAESGPNFDAELLENVHQDDEYNVFANKSELSNLKS
nr:hypothetical protein [Tanacetum cinerariifolium]